MNKKLFFFLFVAAACISSCVRTKPIGTGETIQRQWMLKTLPGIFYGDLLAARAEINLSDISRSQAFAGCNRIFFTTKTGRPNTISFENIGSTKMYCAETMHVENALIEALSQVRQYELNGHQIIFKDASGKSVATAVAADWD